MHAALERAGIGAPCGLAARFEATTPPEMAEAITTARRQFPVLQTRLVWRGDRARLEALPFDDTADQVWSNELTTDGGAVWLTARWKHAVADGHSMLRFLKTVAAVMDRAELPAFEPQSRPYGRRQHAAQWLPGFLAQQCRHYARVESPEPTPGAGTTWRVSSPSERDAILEAASNGCGGFIGPLAAATALSLIGLRDARESALISLNIPILRDDLAAVNGFGFGVGSVIFPIRVRRGARMASLSGEIACRVRRMARLGWDANLNLFLGQDPRRHHRFAAIRARRRDDPAITISWKGRHALGGRVRDVACFAGSPSLHVSAHADEQGLSISLTSQQPAAQRERLLEDIFARLGVSPGPALHLRDATPCGRCHATDDIDPPTSNRASR